jgi:hypothetical protein
MVSNACLYIFCINCLHTLNGEQVILFFFYIKCNNGYKDGHERQFRKIQKTGTFIIILQTVPESSCIAMYISLGKGGGRGWQNLAFLSVINVK